MSSLIPDTSIYPGMRLHVVGNHDALIERTATGGFGVVAFGQDRFEGNKIVAFKTLRRDLLDLPKVRQSFVRECLLWRGFWPHPNIVRVYSVTEMMDGIGIRPFIALHYAEYGNLRDRLLAAQQTVRGRLELDDGLYLAQCIAAGLTYLHAPDPTYLRSAPTVHRDLKPENVLLVQPDIAAITDFGLAKAIESAPEAVPAWSSTTSEEEGAISPENVQLRTSANVWMGTIPYMPFEQWHDARTAGPKADIYAFGVILSELLAGRHALLDGAPPLYVWERAHAAPQPRSLRDVEPQVPEQVELLYIRSLDIDAARRPTAAEALRILQAAATEGGTRVYEPQEVVPHTPQSELAFWNNWSNAYASFHLNDEALLRNERALRIAPDNLVVLLGHANLLGELGQDSEAIAAYSELLERIPVEQTRLRASVWYQMGLNHRKQSRHSDAEVAFAESVKLDRTAMDTPFIRAQNQAQWGEQCANNGDLHGAIDHLEQARQQSRAAVALQHPTAPLLLQAIEQRLSEIQH
jgi:serine/threonine protein kinase